METRKTKKPSVQTTTTVAEPAPRRELTWIEEMVVRSRRGLSESREYPLEFRGRSNPELRARLALMEAHLLSEMHAAGPLAEASADVDQGLKSRILAKLASVEDDS